MSFFLRSSVFLSFFFSFLLYACSHACLGKTCLLAGLHVGRFLRVSNFYRGSRRIRYRGTFYRRDNRKRKNILHFAATNEFFFFFFHKKFMRGKTIERDKNR